MNKDAGDLPVALGADNVGNGLVYTQSAKGNNLVLLSSTVDGGVVNTYLAQRKSNGVAERDQ